MAIVGYYKLDSDVNDLSGNGNNGSNTGVTFASGQINNAGSFDGIADKIDTFGISETGDWSIALWVYLDTNSNTYYYPIGLSTTKGIFFGGTGQSQKWGVYDGTSYLLGGVVSTLTWTHLMVTKTGTTYTLYINSVQDATGTLLDIDIDDLNIGVRADDTLWFDGLIDDVRIYDSVLTLNERQQIYYFSGQYEVTLGGKDYSTILVDHTIEDESIYKTGKVDVTLDDDGTINTSVNRYAEIVLYENGVEIFTGVIIDKNPGKGSDTLMYLFCMDYWWYWLRTPQTKQYTNQTASQIITDIVNNNEDIASLGLSTAGISATTIQYSDRYLGRACSDIAVDLAVNEDFVVFVDETKQVVFRSNNAVDSGLSFDNANDDIIDYDFPERGKGLVNVVRVRGKPGSPPNNAPVAVIYEDDALVEKYGRLPMLEVNAPELATEDECVKRAIYEIKKRNEDPKKGWLQIPYNTSVKVGELITITISEESISEETYYVQSVKHMLSGGITEAKLLYYTRNNADLVQAILERSIAASQYLSDDAVVFTKFKVKEVELTVNATTTIDRRSNDNADYGLFDYGERYYGQVNTDWENIVTDENVTVVNKQFETLLRIISQIATVPNVLNGTNAHIALGSGSTTVQVTDTALESEAYRLDMEATYPTQPSGSQLTFQSILDDTDATTFTITNIGLFNDPSSGEMQCAKVLDSSVAKIEGDDIRISITITISGTEFTTAGLALLIDLYDGTDVTNFLDNSNAAIEIPTTTPGAITYREGMPSASYPAFADGNFDTMKFQINISGGTGGDIDTNSLDGEAFTQVDLYNKTVTGTQVTDSVVGSTTFNILENLNIQKLLKLIRSG